MWESLLCRTQSSGGWALSSQPARPGAPGALSGVVCGGRAPLGIRGSEMAGALSWGQRKKCRGEAVQRCPPCPGRRGQRPEGRGRQAAQRREGPETRRPGVREGRGRVNHRFLGAGTTRCGEGGKDGDSQTGRRRGTPSLPRASVSSSLTRGQRARVCRALTPVRCPRWGLSTASTTPCTRSAPSRRGPSAAQDGWRGGGGFATPPEGFWEQDEEADLILKECPLSNNFP